VEDEGPRVPVPRQRSPSPRVGLAHSESFLQGQRGCTLYVMSRALACVLSPGSARCCPNSSDESRARASPLL
jgi:hypothetical protein